MLVFSRPGPYEHLSLFLSNICHRFSHGKWVSQFEILLGKSRVQKDLMCRSDRYFPATAHKKIIEDKIHRFTTKHFLFVECHPACWAPPGKGFLLYTVAGWLSQCSNETNQENSFFCYHTGCFLRAETMLNSNFKIWNASFYMIHFEKKAQIIRINIYEFYGIKLVLSGCRSQEGMSPASWKHHHSVSPFSC